MNAIQVHYGRESMNAMPMIKELIVVKLTADAVTAKSMYPITESSEVAMPAEDERIGCNMRK
ncbi:MAG: hypothetical protein IJ468_00150 [Lachnospiraceae bacterium]|nr:hypothetical protein [Lachnospiraceae bacterium]